MNGSTDLAEVHGTVNTFGLGSDRLLEAHISVSAKLPFGSVRLQNTLA